MSTGKDVTYLISLRDQFSSKLGNVQSKTKAFEGQMNGLNSTVKRFGRILADAFAVKKIFEFGRESVKLYNDQVQAEAQVKAGLISTGYAAGVSFEKLKKSAAELQEKTLFGDETILQNATAKFLTFSNISGENLLKVQKTALDLTSILYGTAASGESLRSISIQLGKALDDPSHGLMALRKSGVSFSESQVNLIKHLQETNQLAKAQTYILDAVNKQYGGSAEAAAKAGTGPLNQFRNSFNDIRETFGEFLNDMQIKLLPVIQKIAKGFAVLVQWLKTHEHAITVTIKVIVGIIAVMTTFRITGFLIAKSLQLATVATNLYRIANVVMSRGLGSAIAMVNGFRAAIASTGIGLLVVALGFLIAKLMKVKSAQSEVNDKMQEFIDLRKRITQDTQTFDNRQFMNLAQRKELLDDIKSSYEQVSKELNIALGQQDNLNKKIRASDPKNKAILNISAYALGIGINNSRKQLELLKKQIDTIKKENPGIEKYVAGGTTTTQGDQITKIESAAPKVFNINIQKLVDTFTVNSETVKESTADVKQKILETLLGALNDVQITANI